MSRHFPTHTSTYVNFENLLYIRCTPAGRYTPSSAVQNKTRDIANFQKNPNSAMCTVLLLMNLADPAWIRVECDKQLIENVLCYFDDKPITDDHRTYVDMKIFDQSCVIINKTCYLFKWIKVIISEIDPKRIDKTFITLNFEYLFDALSVPFPPIISPDFKQKLTYRKYGRIFNYNGIQFMSLLLKVFMFSRIQPINSMQEETFSSVKIMF